MEGKQNFDKEKPSMQKKMAKKPSPKKGTIVKLPKKDLLNLNLKNEAKLINHGAQTKQQKKSIKKVKVINSPATLVNDNATNQSNFVISDPTKVFTVILNNGQIPCLATNSQSNVDPTTNLDNFASTQTVFFNLQQDGTSIETSDVKLEDIKIEMIRDPNAIATVTR